ncbi:MAG: bile acid:sodium symporter family protein [Thermoguttaceae bacterium]
MSRFGLDWFILALGGVILLAYFVPQPGAVRGPVSPHDLCNYGVSFIFFFYGLGLSWRKFVEDLENWHMQVVVHFFTFLAFPCLVLACTKFCEPFNPQEIWIGIFFLAALPSTVTSSVVMVSIAKGNVPAAIFCASISSVLGLLVTPLWMSYYLSNASFNFDLWATVRTLIILVLVPIVVGMALNKKFGTLYQPYKKTVQFLDQLIVLMIVYVAFCESFIEKVFSAINVVYLATLFVEMIALFVIIYSLIFLVCRLLKFNRDDTITTLFCGSKKSVMHGTAMGKIIFAGNPAVGIILLPIMVYHALQLVIISVIAVQYGKQKPNSET